MLLINRNFAFLWLGQFVSQLGDKAYSIALLWWVFDRTGSPASASLLLVSSLVPELFISPIAGAVIDRLNRKTVLVTADLARGVIILSITYLYASDNLEVWQAFAAAGAISAFSAFFNPAALAAVPDIVDDSNIQNANAVSQLSSGAISVAGPLIGASSVALFGYIYVFIFNAASYLLSALSAFAIQFLSRRPYTKEPIINSIRAGFRYIKDNRKVRSVIIVISIVHVIVGGLLITLPVLAVGIPGNGANNLGILQASVGAGLVAGGLIIKRLAARWKPNKLFGVVCSLGASLTLLGLTAISPVPTRLILTASVCLMAGACVAAASISWRTILQTSVPREKAGRVFSLASTAGNVSLPVSIWITGAILGTFQASTILVIAGLAFHLAGLWITINKSAFLDG